MRTCQIYQVICMHPKEQLLSELSSEGHRKLSYTDSSSVLAGLILKGFRLDSCLALLKSSLVHPGRLPSKS